MTRRVCLFTALLVVALVFAAAAQLHAGEREEADALLNKGIEHWRAAQYQQAIGCYEKALLMYKNLDFRKGQGWCLGNLGVTYYSLGDYRKAIEYYEKALPIAEETVDKQHKGRWLGNLAVAYEELRDYRTAIEYYRKVV